MLIVPTTIKNAPKQVPERDSKSFTRFVQLIIFSAVCLTLSGCASIAGNNTRAVNVQSKPAGATIYIDNEPYGTTPAIVTLPSYIYGGKSATLKKKVQPTNA